MLFIIIALKQNHLFISNYKKVTNCIIIVLVEQRLKKKNLPGMPGRFFQKMLPPTNVLFAPVILLFLSPVLRVTKVSFFSRLVTVDFVSYSW